MVSIKDLAAACGVSVATISKALNGRSDISEATRLRVLHIAETMGYMPNSAARALKTNRTYNLGVLFVDESQNGLTNEYFAAVLDAFKRAAEDEGYDITFINRNIGKRQAGYLEHCRYRGVDGVVAACVDFADPEVIRLMQSDLPVVTVDYVFDNRAAVLSDNAAGMQQIVHHLGALGHRRIAYIHGERFSSVTEKRLAGYYKACAEAGIPTPDEYVLPAVYHDVQSSAVCTQKLLALPNRPTAILYPDDFSAVGGIHAAIDAGLCIPEDLSIAGYDGTPLAAALSPRLTTYRQDTNALGRRAAQLLIAQVDAPRSTLPEQYTVSGRLQVGGSTAVSV